MSNRKLFECCSSEVQLVTEHSDNSPKPIFKPLRFAWNLSLCIRQKVTPTHTHTPIVIHTLTLIFIHNVLSLWLVVSSPKYYKKTKQQHTEHKINKTRFVFCVLLYFACLHNTTDVHNDKFLQIRNLCAVINRGEHTTAVTVQDSGTVPVNRATVDNQQHLLACSEFRSQ